MDNEFMVFLDALVQLINTKDMEESEIDNMFDLINQTTDSLGYDFEISTVQEDEYLEPSPIQSQPVKDNSKLYQSYIEFLQQCVAQDRNIIEVLTNRIKELEE